MKLKLQRFNQRWWFVQPRCQSANVIRWACNYLLNIISKACNQPVQVLGKWLMQHCSRVVRGLSLPGLVETTPQGAHVPFVARPLPLQCSCSHWPTGPDLLRRFRLKSLRRTNPQPFTPQCVRLPSANKKRWPGMTETSQSMLISIFTSSNSQVAVKRNPGHTDETNRLFMSFSIERSIWKDVVCGSLEPRHRDNVDTV